jgi:hypothetical protein
MLQVGRSRVRFPMTSLDFAVDLTLPAALWPWVRPGIFVRSKGWPAPKAHNLTVSQPYGSPRPVTGIPLPLPYPNNRRRMVCAAETIVKGLSKKNLKNCEHLFGVCGEPCLLVQFCIGVGTFT